jgi:hypothetical protein
VRVGSATLPYEGVPPDSGVASGLGRDDGAACSTALDMTFPADEDTVTVVCSPDSGAGEMMSSPMLVETSVLPFCG